MTSADKVLVIWRSHLLAGSETFVRNHGAALTRWRPRYLGAVRVDSAIAADTDEFAYPSTDRSGFLRLKLTGSSPRLRDRLAELRPAVVHAHFGNDGWLVSQAANQLGVPLVVTLHGYDVTRLPGEPGWRGARYRRNLRQMFTRADVVIGVSEFIRDRAVALGADPAKVRVHHTGVPIPPPQPPAPKRWDLLFVGRFVEKKGVDDLVEAAARLDDVRPRILFVGSGPLEQPIRDRAAELGLDATFLGAQTPTEVRRHMAESRIFVSPSKTAANGESEGLPTTILEAATLGVPTVSTYHSGIPEAVRHDGTGLLGAEGDRPALAANLRRLLADEGLRSRLGEQARQRVSTHFDLAIQTARLEELYDSLLTRSAAAPQLG